MIYLGRIFILLYFFIPEIYFSQSFNTLFEVEKIIPVEIEKEIDEREILLTTSGDEVAYILPTDFSEDSIVVKFIDKGTFEEWNEVFHLTVNFLFFVPVDNLTGFTFDENYLVLRFSDVKDYLCVFDRFSRELVQIIPTFDRLAQIKLVNGFVYFAKHYNAHEKQSPYKTYMGKIDWRKLQLVAFDTPEFDFIEFSHFSPNDWFDVNGQGLCVFGKTLDYSLSFYDKNIDSLNSAVIQDGWWEPVDKDSIRKVVSSEENHKNIIYALIPFHNSINRVQTVSFINDSTLLVSKVVRNQQEKNNLRYFDLLRLIMEGKTVKVEPLVLNVPDEELKDNERISLNRYEYRIRNKTHIFSEDKLVFFDFFYTNLELGSKKREFDKKNEQGAIDNERRKAYLVIARLRDEFRVR